jgi:hypothetical protein
MIQFRLFCPILKAASGLEYGRARLNNTHTNNFRVEHTGHVARTLAAHRTDARTDLP